MEPHENSPETRAPDSRVTVGNRRCAMRMLRDPNQGMVLVYETEPAAGVSEPASLVFETGSWRVRLEHYPPEWRRMSDQALLDLRSPADQVSEQRRTDPSSDSTPTVT